MAKKKATKKPAGGAKKNFIVKLYAVVKAADEDAAWKKGEKLARLLAQQAGVESADVETDGVEEEEETDEEETDEDENPDEEEEDR